MTALFRLAFVCVNSFPHVSCFFFFFFFLGGGGGGGGILFLGELQCLMKLFSVNNINYLHSENDFCERDLIENSCLIDHFLLKVSCSSGRFCMVVKYNVTLFS